MKYFRAGIPAFLIALALISGTLSQVQAAQSKTFTGVVNINTASESELMQLPGIGAAKAQAIVERRATAPFKDAAQLMEVKGIGDKLFAKLRDHVSVGGAASGSTAVKPVPGTPVRVGQ